MSSMVRRFFLLISCGLSLAPLACVAAPGMDTSTAEALVQDNCSVQRSASCNLDADEETAFSALFARAGVPFSSAPMDSALRVARFTITTSFLRERTVTMTNVRDGVEVSSIALTDEDSTAVSDLFARVSVPPRAPGGGGSDSITETAWVSATSHLFGGFGESWSVTATRPAPPAGQARPTP
jgi:hypothetical protein